MHELDRHDALFFEKLRGELVQRVNRFAGVAGISILDLTSGQEIVINGDEVFPTASSIKIHILTQLILRAEQGELDLAARIQLDPNEIVFGSGILAHLDGPVEMTVLDIAILMIIVSDNTATNICLRLAGLAETNAMLNSLGLVQTRVRRKMQDHLAAVQEQENVSTPNELVRMMALLREGKPTPATAAKVLEILRKPKNSTLTNALPENVVIANKPGYVDGARCDVGIVELARRPYIVAIMSKYAMDDAVGHAASLVEMAQVIHKHFVAMEKSNRYGRYVY